MSAIEDIQQKAWTNIEFNLPITDRARYTMIGNQLIDLVLKDDKLRQALTFVLAESDDPRSNQANLFTVSPALHSADDKLWLHAGYQTRSHVNSAIPEIDQPEILREFLDAVDQLLLAIEDGFSRALRSIGADDVATIVYDAEYMKRAIHIRIVRYTGARLESAPQEPVTGHADMSLCTLHLYETHGNWFQAAPYPQELISEDQSPDHQAAIAAMRSNFNVIKEVDDQAVFFLGAGWKKLPKDNPPKKYQTLPACYHAGVRPAAEDEYISPYAQEVAGNDTDRVSLVVFAQPNLDYANENNFVYPGVLECRPDTAVEL